MSGQRQLHIGVFFQGVGHTIAWQHPNHAPHDQFETYVRFAQLAERGLLDLIFFGEGLVVREHQGKFFGPIVNGRPDTVALLPAEDVSDKEEDNRKKKLQKPSYKFKITNRKEQGKNEKLIWKLSLLNIDDEETLLVEEDFLYYKHLTRRIEQIKQFASDHSNYAISKNADGYSIYSINDADRPLAVGKRKFRMQEELEAEITALIRFFSYEVDRLTEENENFDDISYYADPYSLRVSIFIPSWPRKFQNPTFKHLFEKSIYLETPSHISSRVYWLDHRQMLEFEQAYKLWLEELANSEIPNTEIVNNFIDVLNKSRK